MLNYSQAGTLELRFMFGRYRLTGALTGPDYFYFWVHIIDQETPEIESANFVQP